MLDGPLHGHVDRGAQHGVPVQATALAIFGMCNWVNKWYRPSGESARRRPARTPGWIRWRGPSCLSGPEIADIWTDVVLGGLRLDGTLPSVPSSA
ncbi:hypothetical protein [Actinomycetospora straminea]|uniref:hypothetical protein n=1 Tax=Actinomycetospora straminea TaxID=663607 RepID=UPI0023662786|nr:hypothetical protein [Actinomycetospora straminea]MDD7933773.1 hypothetical protein [Actinomycetospora straminea]